MKITKMARTFVVMLMSLLMSHLPAVAWADGMISTSTVVADLNRAQAQQNVQAFLSRQDVREELMKRGVSAEEASQRLASLSETEMRQLAGQVEQARAGGDILVAILLVVLIIFLIKRI